MNHQNFEVIPLFSSPITVFSLSEDLSSLLRIKENYEFVKTKETEDGFSNSYITSNLKILDDFPTEKKIILNYFLIYKNFILRYENIDFNISTSWATKIEMNGYSQFHNHDNSVYSGILYFDDIEDGDLEFQPIGIFPKQIALGSPSEWNVYNSNRCKISSKKNKLIFFPSYLYHRVNVNHSTTPRYSLAFNFFPYGNLGNGDSSVKILKIG